MHSSRSHNAVIRVYDEAANVIETHEHTGDFNSKRHGVKQRAATQLSLTALSRH
jgi:hypothetical protein